MLTITPFAWPPWQDQIVSAWAHGKTKTDWIHPNSNKRDFKIKFVSKFCDCFHIVRRCAGNKPLWIHSIICKIYHWDTSSIEEIKKYTHIADENKWYIQCQCCVSTFSSSGYASCWSIFSGVFIFQTHKWENGHQLWTI